MLLVRGGQSNPVKTVAARERVREQVRGTLGRKLIEDANIVDHELPVFGYHADLNLPGVASVKGSTSRAEVDEGLYRPRSTYIRNDPSFCFSLRSTSASIGEAWFPSPEKKPDVNQTGFGVRSAVGCSRV